MVKITLADLVESRIKGYEPAAGLLARYEGGPAVFYLDAPEEENPGWEGEHYPYVCCSLDGKGDKEKKSAGSLILKLRCRKAPAFLERLEQTLLECMEDVLLTAKGDAPACFSWADTKMLEASGQGLEGREMVFDIFKYPSQETTDPDPVDAVNRYIGQFYPAARVLHCDSGELPAQGELAVSPSSPVFYCRLETVEKVRETNTVVWMNARISVFLLCPDTEIRRKMAAAAANSLSMEDEVLLADGSPMYIKQVQVNHQADGLTDGQLSLLGEYGILRYQEKKHQIQEKVKMQIKEKS